MAPPRKKNLGPPLGEMEGIRRRLENYSQAVKEGLSKEQLDKAIVQIADVPKDTMKEEREFQVRLTEAMERDKRKNNVVIRGLNENLSDTETKDFLEEMFCKIMVNERSNFEVKGRIGKTGDKCRPLRIEFEEPVYKRDVLKKANTLNRKVSMRGYILN